jgi:putative transposase
MLMIADVIWNEIKTVIPEKKSKLGRPLSDAKLILSGIFYIMTTGAQWRCLPDYYGKKSTVHGRFMIWVRSGVFQKILDKSIEVAIKKFGEPEAFFSDTSSVKAPFAKFSGKNPIDRAKRGVKKGLVIDMNSVILSILVDAANVHDSQLYEPHINTLKKFASKDKPKVLVTDSAGDVEQLRKNYAKENIALHASTNVRRNKKKRKIKTGGRWRMEQVFGIQQWNRGIKSCWTKTKEAFLALCQFVAAIHNFKLAGVFG